MNLQQDGGLIDAQARFLQQQIGIVEGSGLPSRSGHRAGQSSISVRPLPYRNSNLSRSASPSGSKFPSLLIS